MITKTTVRLPPAVDARLREECERRGVTMSAAVQRAVMDWLNAPSPIGLNVTCPLCAADIVVSPMGDVLDVKGRGLFAEVVEDELELAVLAAQAGKTDSGRRVVRGLREVLLALRRSSS